MQRTVTHDELKLVDQMSVGHLEQILRALKPALESQLDYGPFVPRFKVAPDVFLRHFILFAALAAKYDMPIQQPATHPLWDAVCRANPEADMAGMAFDVSAFFGRLRGLGLRRKFCCFLQSPEQCGELFPLEQVQLRSKQKTEHLARHSERLVLRYRMSDYSNLSEVVSQMEEVEFVGISVFDSSADLQVFSASPNLARMSLASDYTAEGEGDLGQLLHVPDLRWLSIADSIAPDVKRLPDFQFLQHLQIDSHKLKNHTTVSRYSTLRHLSLSGRRIQEPDLAWLADLTQLRELHLPMSQLGAYGGLGTAELESFDLGEACFKSTPDFSGLPPTGWLDLSGSRSLSDIGGLAGTRIQKLKLGRIGQVSSLKPLQDVSGLQYVGINGTYPEDGDYSVLARIPGLRQCTIDRKQHKKIPGLSEQPHLEVRVV